MQHGPRRRSPSSRTENVLHAGVVGQSRGDASRGTRSPEETAEILIAFLPDKGTRLRVLSRAVGHHLACSEIDAQMYWSSLEAAEVCRLACASVGGVDEGLVEAERQAVLRRSAIKAPRAPTIHKPGAGTDALRTRFEA